MSEANINDVLGRTQRENNAALERAEAELRQLRREVALLREVEGAVRAHVEDWDSQVSDPGAACYQCEDPSDIKALRTAIKALEAARA